jgi:hypothetical protein
MSEDEGATAFDDSVHELYQLRPDGFVEARDALAKDLKARGDRDASDAIKRFKRPAATAWAVDRLAADDPGTLAELFAANDRLRAVMAGSGKETRERFRAASDERQRIVTRLTERAGSILEDAGLPAGRSNLDRIASTLMATATDEAGADLIRAGILDQDLSAAGGFGGAFGAPLRDADEPRSTVAPDPKREATARRRHQRAESDATERAAQAKEAERVATEAEREADEAEREAERVTRIAAARRREADRARREADKAADLARTAIETAR